MEEAGIDCLVTPPSLLPIEYGNRVKTDRRDSRKLAHLLAKGHNAMENLLINPGTSLEDKDQKIMGQLANSLERLKKYKKR